MCIVSSHHFLSEYTFVARTRPKLIMAENIPRFFLKEIEPDKGHSVSRECPRRQKPEEIEVRGWP